MKTHPLKTYKYKHSRGTTAIVIGEVEPSEYLNKAGMKYSPILVVTSQKVYNVWKEKAEDLFKNLSPEIIVLPDGEKAKAMTSLSKIYSRLQQMNMRKNGLVVSIGGGTISDVAGYAASTFMRGVHHIIIPTTLLSQADAAIGGKTGVNYKQIKNLIGSFYQPDYVFVNPIFLSTLPKREFVSGLAEVLKCAFLRGSKAVGDFERYVASGSGNKSDLLLEQIEKAIKTKLDLINQDEFDCKNKRALLNYGHTIGHALESTNQLKKLKHGEAVALGIIASSYISYKSGWIANSMLRKTVTLIKKAELPTTFSKIKTGDAMDFIKHDKKRMADNILMLVPIKNRIESRPIPFNSLQIALTELSKGVLDEQYD